VNRLQPLSVGVAIALLLVTNAWNSLFNTIVDYAAVTYFDRDNGYQEIVLRLTYAILLTLAVVFLARRASALAANNRQRLAKLS